MLPAPITCMNSRLVKFISAPTYLKNEKKAADEKAHAAA
jgi:hypothetical protein